MCLISLPRAKITTVAHTICKLMRGRSKWVDGHRWPFRITSVIDINIICELVSVCNDLLSLHTCFNVNAYNLDFGAEVYSSYVWNGCWMCVDGIVEILTSFVEGIGCGCGSHSAHCWVLSGGFLCRMLYCD